MGGEGVLPTRQADGIKFGGKCRFADDRKVKKDREQKIDSPAQSHEAKGRQAQACAGKPDPHGETRKYRKREHGDLGIREGE